MPVCTPNQSICLQQGEKWRTNKYFQQTLFSVNGFDFWSGDIVDVKVEEEDNPFLLSHPFYARRLLIESFHTCEGKTYARGYKADFITGFMSPFFHSTYLDVLVGDLVPVLTMCNFDLDSCSSVVDGLSLPLIEYHRSLLSTAHFLKKPASDSTFYKVKIAPLILFTDHTSGNRSKQFNIYESWSMKCASLTFEDRSSIDNIHFIADVPKKDGASGLSVLPAIVEDLKKLENGIIMYSAEHKEDVVVVAPLLWIEADTPCHTELCGLLGPAARYPCRKCYMRLTRSTNKKLEKLPVLH